MFTERVKPDEVIRPKRNPWADNLFRPAILIMMIMCINVAVVQLVWQANPAWRATYFLLGMLITTIEAVYSHRMQRQYRSRGGSMLRYRLVEMVLLILVLKLISFIGQPWTLIVAEAEAIWGEPTRFLTTEFYVVVCLAIAAWAAATFTIDEIDSLYDPYVDNRVALDSLAERFFWGGGLLVLISGITQWIARAGVNSLLDLNRPALSGVVLNVLLYFTLGLILLSQINLTRLQVRWQVQKIAVGPGLVKRWAVYGLLFLGLITAVSFILPTAYALGFLTTIGYLLVYIFNLLIFLFQLVILLITLPLVFLLNWFGYSAPDPMTMTQNALPPVLPNEDTEAPAWITVLRSFLFWLVALTAVGYLIKTYLDDRPELVQQLLSFRPVALLVRAVRWLSQTLRHLLATGMAQLPTRIQRPATARRLPDSIFELGWINWRGLSPRDRVIRYYLNIVQRAEQGGTIRAQSQTPYEFEPDLTLSAPDVEQEIDKITEAFVEARYSETDIDQGQVARVQRWWQHIKRRLRRHSRQNQTQRK